jgi:methionyl-tRNA formyltransferase
MKVALVSRFPRVDTPAWKRTLADQLRERGLDLAVVYSRSALADQAQAGLREFGLGVVSRYARRGQSSGPTDSGATTTLDLWAQRLGIERHHGRRLSEPETTEWVRGFAPDLMILVGADIVPAALLKIPRLGTINPHYGLLPRYRGMNVTEWSIYHDDPVGVTVHAVDPSIDTGDILIREPLEVPVGATLASIREQQQHTSARLLEEAAAAMLAGSARPVPQQLDQGRQFYRMHPLLQARVARLLQDGEYRWLGIAPPSPDG